jgi:hypothetical protein
MALMRTCIVPVQLLQIKSFLNSAFHPWASIAADQNYSVVAQQVSDGINV